MSTEPVSIALTIAASDSGGGAGIQADLKTFQAFGVFGTSAITAVTAQNTVGVQAVHPIPVDVVRAQIDAVATDLGPGGVKTGMLATLEHVEVVADSIRAHGFARYVLDPVMVATSGDRLLDADAQRAVAERLVPLATLVTPNLPEAAVLVGADLDDEADILAAARTLVDMGAGAALIKGGHLGGHTLMDLLWDGQEAHIWRRPRIDTRNTHGTGCAVSAAACAGLARGLPLKDAVDGALAFVARGIERAPGLGAGQGPLDFGAPGDRA